MNNKKAIRAALAAVLSVAAGAAHAVPIVFDFTGTVTTSSIFTSTGGVQDNSFNGRAVSGRITVETTGLRPTSSSDSSGLTLGYSDSNMDSLTLIDSELFIGGVSYDVGLYPAAGGSLSAFDSSGVSGDFLALRHYSNEYPPMPGPGDYHRRDLNLLWRDAANPLGLLDLSNGFELFDVLPLLQDLLPYGTYNDTTMSCGASGACTNTQVTRNFSIASLTVTSVPEPGTLALFALGLLGAAMGRRRLAE